MTNHFTKKLSEMFEEVESHFTVVTIENYQVQAGIAHEAWVERMSVAKPAAPQCSLYDLMRLPEYTKSTAGSYQFTWDAIQNDIAAGRFVVDYGRAEADAAARSPWPNAASSKRIPRSSARRPS